MEEAASRIFASSRFRGDGEEEEEETRLETLSKCGLRSPFLPFGPFFEACKGIDPIDLSSIGLPCGKGQPNKRAVFAKAWRCCIEGTARCLENLWRMQTPLPSRSDEWFEAPEGVTFHHC